MRFLSSPMVVSYGDILSIFHSFVATVLSCDEIYTASGSGSLRQSIYGGSGQGSLAFCDEPTNGGMLFLIYWIDIPLV